MEKQPNGTKCRMEKKAEWDKTSNEKMSNGKNVEQKIGKKSICKYFGFLLLLIYTNTNDHIHVNVHVYIRHEHEHEHNETQKHEC